MTTLERKEHGLLYKAEMGRAILRDVDPKTQTRRPVTFYNSTTDGIVSKKEWPNLRWEEATLGSEVIEGKTIPYWTVPIHNVTVRISPRIRPGDLIWGRETFRLYNSREECACYDDCSCASNNGKPIYYASSLCNEAKWTPSILMPRWVSRLELDVLNVRSQRIQEISEASAKAEGIIIHDKGGEKRLGKLMYSYQSGEHSNWELNPITAFKVLWDSINVARGFSWADNHPVWAYEFKRIVEDAPA